jgi:hypothetical protein
MHRESLYQEGVHTKEGFMPRESLHQIGDYTHKRNYTKIDIIPRGVYTKEILSNIYLLFKVYTYSDINYLRLKVNSALNVEALTSIRKSKENDI